MSSSPSFTSIPILNLSLAHSSSPSDKKELLNKLYHALTSVGFLYITNHNVSSSVISDLVNALPKLFSPSILTEKTKAEIALHNSPHFLGYSSVGAETTAGKLDRREQVEYATELDEKWTSENGLPLYERLKGPNQVLFLFIAISLFSLAKFRNHGQWPSEYPELRAIVEKYIYELTALSERFLELVAEALSLPREVFSQFLSEQHRLKLVHYPASSSADRKGNEEEQGVGPHKDSSGWWTFLLQASPPSVKGLQALNREGQWINIPNIPGTFVVNIGQAFEVVTNGVCKATVHRVVIPSGQASERYSIPFFQGVRGNLTKEEAVGTLREHFWKLQQDQKTQEGHEKRTNIDSPFLKGKYNTWGESQLRIKIRSHRDVGRKFYGDVYEKYVNDD
jgi:isopenicillin N synthase-like dioxygenase